MAAPNRWGSFLSQAVAGVEARLDNILAENEDGTPQQKDSKPAAPVSPAKQSPGMSRRRRVVPKTTVFLTPGVACRSITNGFHHPYQRSPPGKTRKGIGCQIRRPQFGVYPGQPAPESRYTNP